MTRNLILGSSSGALLNRRPIYLFPFLLCSFLVLISTNTNYIYVSAALTMLAPLYAFVWPIDGARVGRVQFWTSIFLIYVVVSTALYHAQDLLDFGFYRRDGNVLISFSPLLCFWLFYRSGEPLRPVRLFVILSSMMILIVYMKYVLTGSNIFSIKDSARSYGSSSEFTYLFVAHNAAGGFISEVCILSLLFMRDAYRRKDTAQVAIYFLTSLATLLALLDSGSRGSIIPIGIVSIFIFFFDHRRRAIVYVFGAILLIEIAATYYYLHNYSFVVDCFDEGGTDPWCLRFLTMNSDVMNISTGRDANIVFRVNMLWPRALDMFLSSPIFGIGFGSYNDVPFNPYGIAGVFSLSNPSSYMNSDAHAHNSYFHIAAEMGLLGLYLVFKVISTLLEASTKVSGRLERDIVFYLIWCLVIMSLSEHRLFTPSNALPVFIITSWIIAHQRRVVEPRAFEPSHGLIAELRRKRTIDTRPHQQRVDGRGSIRRDE